MATEEYIQTGSQNFNVVVSHYGDAAGTAKQFEKMDPSAINETIQALQDAYNFAGEISNELVSIQKNLNACWRGQQHEQESKECLCLGHASHMQLFPFYALGVESCIRISSR